MTDTLARTVPPPAAPFWQGLVYPTAWRQELPTHWDGLLTPDEQECYQRNAKLVVLGSHGGIYWITNGEIGNVVQLDEHGCGFARWCFAPKLFKGWGGSVQLKERDIHVGQALALKADELRIMSTAAVLYGLHPCQMPLGSTVQRDRFRKIASDTNACNCGACCPMALFINGKEVRQLYG